LYTAYVHVLHTSTVLQRETTATRVVKDSFI